MTSIIKKLWDTGETSGETTSETIGETTGETSCQITG
jgi:hypothetical protein